MYSAFLFRVQQDFKTPALVHGSTKSRSRAYEGSVQGRRSIKTGATKHQFRAADVSIPVQRCLSSSPLCLPTPTLIHGPTKPQSRASESTESVIRAPSLRPPQFRAVQVSMQGRRSLNSSTKMPQFRAIEVTEGLGPAQSLRPLYFRTNQASIQGLRAAESLIPAISPRLPLCKADEVVQGRQSHPTLSQAIHSTRGSPSTKRNLRFHTILGQYHLLTSHSPNQFLPWVVYLMSLIAAFGAYEVDHGTRGARHGGCPQCFPCTEIAYVSQSCRGRSRVRFEGRAFLAIGRGIGDNSKERHRSCTGSTLIPS
jgi:hypothetical protein